MKSKPSRHRELALVPYLRGELAAEERADVESHLGACASCRAALDDFRAVIDALRAEPHEPPDIDWRRYRSELRAKRETREAGASAWGLPRLVPVFATAAIAGLALFFTLRGTISREGAGDELPVFEQTALGSRLDLLKHYDVVDNLDLLEDLDLVQDLDDTAGEAPVEQG